MATVLYLAGFSEQDAKAIALAAWAPDTDNRNAITVLNLVGSALPGMPQQSNHLLDGESDPGKVKAVQEYWADQVGEILKLIKTLENNPVGKSAVLSDPEVQRALHAFGDSFAHVKPDGTHFDEGHGHLIPSITGGDPDNPYTNKDAFLKYAITIYDLGAAATIGAARRDAGYVNDLASRIVSYESEATQKGILDNAALLSTGNWPSGLVNSPVSECGKIENCNKRTPTNTVNPVIRKIYNLDPPPKYHAPVVDWSKLPH